MALDLTKMTLEELAQVAGGSQPGTVNQGAMLAEFARRQTMAQIEAAKAQKRAAIATEKTAEATKRSAFYMLVYLLIAAAALIASIVVPFLSRHH